MADMDQSENAADRLLDLVATVEAELHPSRSTAVPVTLDSLFDRELALDSLGRMELFLRVEQAFDVTLPESLFGSVETPRDMLRSILGATGTLRAFKMFETSPVVRGGVVEVPSSTETLIDVLNWHVQHHPDRLTVRFFADDESAGETLSYRELYSGAQRIAVGLQKCELRHGESVALMLATGKEYFFSFLGILMAGGVPVPIYPPARPKQLEDHLRRHTAILNNCLTGVLITMPEAKMVASLFKLHVATMRHVVTPEDLAEAPGALLEPHLKASDTAFLQYTSGSTGTPKGVTLTHANLLANLRAMGTAAEVSADDVIVSWLPLYHDMGLIGAWLGSLYYACPLIIMSPLAFLTRPNRWLWAIHRYRGTISAAPNFAYELAMRNFKPEDFEGLDLSSWRFALNGAEGVNPGTINRFCDQFAPFGFRRESMAPVYGLAENTVGVAFPPMNRGARIDRVKRDTFLKDGIAVPTDEEGRSGIDFAGCGHALPWHQIRIVDAKDRELPERREGRLQFCGPSATSGYFRNPQETQRLFHGTWLDTEDMAYIAEGELFITGRSKDIIIKAGRNIYPVELEEAVGDVDGVRKGNVAVFGSTVATPGTERLIILAETRETSGPKRQKIETTINQVAVDVIGSPPDVIALAPPGTILKTSSGKIRRKDCRTLFETGQIGKTERSVWLQAVRFALSSILPQMRQKVNALRHTAFALYGWIVTIVIGLSLWLAAMIVPRLSWRWGIITRLVQITAWITRTPVTVNGLENLPPPDQPCVFVANHSSYLDHFGLIAAVPRRLNFVAKSDLAKNPLLRLPLQQMGVQFVERVDKEKGVADAKRMAGLAKKGQFLLFYPEGTFHRMPGLLPFHMGAFTAAEDADVPVIPIAIRGSRSILRDGSWFPRHGAIRVIIGTPIYPGRDPMDSPAEPWAKSLALRDASRQQLLHLSGEPDLAHERP